MQITDIKPQKIPNRYNVYIDNEFAFGIDGVDLLYHKLAIGKELDAAFVSRLKEELGYLKTRDAALFYIARAQRSAFEIRRHLLHKEYGEEHVNQALDYLNERGYIDDAAYAAAFIQQKYRKNHGKRRIVAELHQKGVSKDDILEGFRLCLADIGQNSEEEAVQRAIDKKLKGKPISGLADIERRKLGQYLARRGFAYDIIKQAISSKGEDL